jgi:hypothetical protein
MYGRISTSYSACQNSAVTSDRPRSSRDQLRYHRIRRDIALARFSSPSMSSRRIWQRWDEPLARCCRNRNPRLDCNCGVFMLREIDIVCMRTRGNFPDAVMSAPSRTLKDRCLAVAPVIVDALTPASIGRKDLLPTQLYHHKIFSCGFSNVLIDLTYLPALNTKRAHTERR